MEDLETILGVFCDLTVDPSLEQHHEPLKRGRIPRVDFANTSKVFGDQELLLVLRNIQVVITIPSEGPQDIPDVKCRDGSR